MEISNNINKMNNTIISMNETILKSNDRLGLLIKEKYNEKKDLKRYENAKDIKGKKIKVINNSIQKNYIYNENKQILINSNVSNIKNNKLNIIGKSIKIRKLFNNKIFSSFKNDFKISLIKDGNEKNNKINQIIDKIRFRIPKFKKLFQDINQYNY